MSYYEKWKERKRLQKEQGREEESNLPALPDSSHSSDAVPTTRYVNSSGNLFEETGTASGWSYDNYSHHSHEHDYSYNRSVVIPKKNNDTRGNQRDYGGFGQDFDYRYYRSSYGDVQDNKHQVIKGNIPYFDMYEANRYVQQRIGEWLSKMGYKVWQDVVKNQITKDENGNAMKPAPYVHRIGSGNPYDTRRGKKSHSNWNGYDNSENAFDTDNMFDKTVVKNHMVNDIYAMYYSDKYSVKELDTPQRQQWFGVLSQLNNYTLKVISINNSVYSSIVTYHIIKNILLSQDKDKESPLADGRQGKEVKDFIEALKNGSFKVQNPDGSEVDIDGSNLSETMQETLQKALKETSEEIANREKMDQIFGKSKGVGEERSRSEVEALIRMNRIDAKLLSKFIQGVIKNTKKATGGAKPKYKEESFMDADEIEELLDLELIPHAALLDDISVHEIEYSQKFDVYVDFSGSMTSHVLLKNDVDAAASQQAKEEDCSVTAIALAKLIYYKMFCMNIIHNVYGFNSSPYKLTHEEFMKEVASGGTQIDAVIEQVEKTTRTPSLIISDLCDSIYMHSKNIFILGIEGRINNHQDEPFQKFVANKQVKMLKNGYVCDYYKAFPKSEIDY